MDAGDEREKLMLIWLLGFISVLHAWLSLAVCRFYDCIMHTVQRAEVVLVQEYATQPRLASTRMRTGKLNSVLRYAG